MDTMNKSWETIFHLSKAMSLLLSEALHNDDYNCPKNISTSLCDLLVIINSFVVKSRQKPSMEDNLPLSSTVNAATHGEREKNNPSSFKGNNSHQSQKELLMESVKIDSICSNCDKYNCSRCLSKNSYSPVFLSISEKMIDGTLKKGYYCHFCKEEFSDDDEWVAHFKSAKIHQDIVRVSHDKLGSCGICKFHVFAESVDLTSLMSYHKTCHQAHHLNSENVSFNPSDDSTCDTSVGDNSEIDDTVSEHSMLTNESPDNIQERRQQKYKTAFKKQRQVKNKINQEFVKTINFVNFCDVIKKNNLINSHYCRPCDKCFTDINKWEKHCIEDKHQRFISSKVFKNYKGICSYCNLEIVGTIHTVQEYMDYHNEKHGKVPSYTCDEIRISQNAMYYKSRRGELPRQRSDKKQTHKSESCDLPDKIKKPIERCDDNDFSYEESEKKKMKCKIIGLYYNQLRDKATYRWFCLPCNIVVEKSLAWIDHLSSIEHRERQTNEDETVDHLNYLNLFFFGKKSFIVDVLKNIKSA